MAKAGLSTIFLWNVFGERGAARAVKYEDIYLKAYADGWELETGLATYFTFYNRRRFHQSLAYQTPEQVFKKGKKEVQTE